MRENKTTDCIALAIFLSSVFFCHKSFAQQDEYVFRHLTTENGLINNIVYCLYQDSKGYIWMGTVDGLQRYDGNRFVNYLPDIHDPEALHNGKISSVFEDSKKRFWIGTDIGAPYLLNRGTGKFYNYSLHQSNTNSLVNGVGKFIEDSKGDIWIMNKYGYYKLNNNTNQFENVSALAGITKDIWAENFDKDSTGNIWFVTHAGISCYNIVSKKIYDKNNNPGHLKIFDVAPDITAFLISGNNFWMGIPDRTALLKYDINKNSIVEYSLENGNLKNNYTAYISARTYNLTGCTDKSVMVYLLAHGIAYYNPLKDSFTEIPIRNEDPDGLHGPVAMEWSTTTLKDRDGNMWVSGGDKGLNIFNPSKRKFTFYGSNFGNDKNTPAYSANGFIQDPVDEDIYAGYYYPTGGIVRYSSNLTIKKKYLFSKAGNNNIPENQVWCLYSNEDGTIWAPNQAGTILQLETRNEKLSVINNTALFANITSVLKDEKDDIWIGCWAGGLKKIDHQTHHVNTFLGTAPGSTVIAENILSLYNDGDSILWTGTNNEGFLQFDKRTNSYTRQYLLDEKNPASISSNTIFKIIPYNDDTLLLATSMGINIFNKKKRTFSNISTKDGLPGNVVGTIDLDGKQNLWAGCIGGYCKINMHSLSITRYGMADGITDNSFSNASVKLKDGKYLVSTEKGFIAFNPADVTDAAPANPVITGFNVFDKDLEIDSLIDAAAPVILSYHDNSIVIEFASLQYNFSDETKYYYRMEGIDHDWILSGKEQAAHYNQLQNGKYVFKIKCVNRDGLTSQSTAELNIIITPPFWKTWWFLLSVFGVIALGVYLLFKWFEKRRNEKELLLIKHEKEMAAVQMKTLRAQMNPHFIFNSLNSINTFILKNDQDNASDYLNKFSRLVRLILDNSRSEWILLENELKALNLYIELESVRFENVFTHTINIAPGLQVGSVMVPPLIIQPYVENAIRHGLINRDNPGGKLSISVWKENNELLIQIEDNGVGRKEAGMLRSKKNPLHQSHGMNITAERIAIVNEIYKVNGHVVITDLNDPVKESKGTRVLLTIQYKTHADNNNR